MPNTSKKTKPFAFRLPIEVVKILENRVAKRHGRWISVGDYLKDRIIYDALRKR